MRPDGASQAGEEAVRELDSAPRSEAIERLRACCGAERWAIAMADRRPFGDLAGLLQAAEAEWAALAPFDWRQAIDHHPRLGGADLASGRFDSTRSLSQGEQAGVLDADGATRRALADAQREYEERFGFIFLIRASGRSAAKVLSELERRMANDPETELAAAARELREIGQLRLERLFGGRERRETRMSVTTHVLDTSTGRPASGVAVRLETRDREGWREVGSARTDADGRARDLMGGRPLEPGVFRLTFATGDYFQAREVESFHPEVSVVFRVEDPAERHHVPLLVSPFGYTTYRGS